MLISVVFTHPQKPLVGMEKQISKSHFFLSFIGNLFALAFLAISLSSFFINRATTHQVQAQSSSFTFGAAGDFGCMSSSCNGYKVLQKANTENLNFLLAVGDLAYGSNLPESTWCQNAKNALGAVPMQIISGNHETCGHNANYPTSIDDGYIDRFTTPTCLPIGLGAIPRESDELGKEYYFDYPLAPAAPLARFILLSPRANYAPPGGSCASPEYYDFVKNDVHYTWAKSKIQEARAAGIPWVIGVNHENYISTGDKTDEIGTDFFNLLLGEGLGPSGAPGQGVDLILQGHDHNYQRSKLLGLNSATCPKILGSGFDADCIKESGSNFTKGQGTVLVINGTGGLGHYPTNVGDTQNPYFSSWNDTAFGLIKFVVTPDQIYGEYKSVVGTHTDSFTISTNPTPPSSPTPVPSSTPPPSSASPSPSPSQSPLPSAGPSTTFVPFGSSWKYLDNGSNQATLWKERTFSDLNWASGSSELGYGDSDEATVVSYGPDSANKYVTTYFRKSFDLTNHQSFSGLTLKLVRDDGGVVYLNGTEVHRSNMPTGAISYTTQASSSIEETQDTVSVPASFLVEGNNTLAVEIHQSNVTSSDISFNLELTGISSGASATPSPQSPSPTPQPTSPTPSPTPAPIPGDANGDGAVNEADYLIWKDHYGQTIAGGNQVGDFDSDSKIDGVDYSIWLSHLVIDSSSPLPTASPAGITYYVDCNSGVDSNAGLSQDSAWQTLTRANAANLDPGQSLLLKRGCVWNEGLLLATEDSGSALQNVLVSAYGSGELPKIQRNANSTVAIKTSGSYITIENVLAEALPFNLDPDCGSNPVGYVLGFSFEKGASYNTLRNSVATGNYAGVYLKAGAHHNLVTNNILSNNIMMNPLDITVIIDGTAINNNNDAGAFGVLIHGNNNEVAYNTISGHDACSYDYVRDGAAVEIYGDSAVNPDGTINPATQNSIHHNRAHNNDAFTELGKETNGEAQNNTYAYNLVTSTLPSSIGVVTRGAGSSYGPVLGTKLFNNTFYLTGQSAQGVVCSSGCSADILTMKNNLIWANWKAAYADAPFGEGHNDYWKTGGSPLIQGYVPTATSIRMDPLFVSSGSDFHLQTSSPAKNIGTDESTTAGFGSDLDGTIVPQGVGVDLGAFEWK